MSAFENLKAKLRATGENVQLQTVTDERRDAESRYREMLLLRDGKPPMSFLVILYDDGSYRPFIEHMGIKIDSDVKAILAA